MKVFRYSALDTATKCLMRYKYQYLDELKVGGSNSIDLEFGTALHLGLETLLKGEEAIEIFTIYWDSVKDKPLAKGAKTWGELRDLGEVFLTRFKRLHAKNYTPKFQEQRMSGTVGGYAFEGTADVLGGYKDVPSIIDFKTSFKEYPKEALLVRPQMPIYAHLAEQTLGYKAEQLVYVVFIKSEARIQTITQKLTKNLLDNHIKNTILICEDLSKRTEYPKNFNSCLMGAYKCPYFDTCYKGAKHEGKS